jgi:hypothetical protein
VQPKKQRYILRAMSEEKGIFSIFSIPFVERNRGYLSTSPVGEKWADTVGELQSVTFQ